MNKHHSTVSRRDFMKGLGLAGAGLGAAAASPVFHDLDEVTSSPEAGYKQPWWVKERDFCNPTTEVDWSVLQRFPKPTYNNQKAHRTAEDFARIAQEGQENVQRWLEEGRPGWTARDRALPGAAGAVLPDLQSLMGGNMGPKQIEPRWEGTLEENSRMLVSVLRLCGASTIGFAEVTEQTKKLIWKGVPGKTNFNYVFEEATSPYYDETGKRLVIPNKCKWAVVYTIRMSTELFRRPGKTSDSGAFLAYGDCFITQGRLQSFMKGIGYSCVGQPLHGTGPIAGWGNLAGLGELGRLQHLITPEWGPMIRMSMMNLIDLPVAPTRPIDFGANRFCHACSRCADICPGEALQTAAEPSWDVTQPYGLVKPELFNNPGLKTWYFDHFKCNSYWKLTGTFCGMCTSACVFTKEGAASIHKLIKPVISSTSLFNGFFVNMDEAFGYGALKDPADWWGGVYPVFGIDYSNDPYIQ